MTRWFALPTVMAGAVLMTGCASGVHQKKAAAPVPDATSTASVASGTTSASVPPTKAITKGASSARVVISGPSAATTMTATPVSPRATTVTTPPVLSRATPVTTPPVRRATTGTTAVRRPPAATRAGASKPVSKTTPAAKAFSVPRMSANRLYIPSLGVNAPIVGARVVNGSLVIPPSWEVGLWSGSAALTSSAGRAVIAGHIDSPSRTNGGAMSAIRNARVGQVAWVSDNHGRVMRFVVRSRSTIPKTSLPSDIFYGGGPMKISLITCGGTIYRDSSGHLVHRDNIVVSLTR